jgi:hypothetical protein
VARCRVAAEQIEAAASRHHNNTELADLREVGCRVRQLSSRARFGDLLAVRDELAGSIVTLGDWPWSQVRARRASFLPWRQSG